MITEKPQLLTRQEFFISLYEKAFPGVAAFVQKMGGNLEDAKDIFQDGLLVFYEKVTVQGTVVESDDKAYLLGICKHLWYKKQRADKQAKQPDHLAGLLPEEEREPRIFEHLLQLMEQSGKRCLDLLQSFYFEKCSMKDIAKTFGFSGERSATAQKYKCLEKIRTAIKNKSLHKEDFYE